MHFLRSAIPILRRATVPVVCAALAVAQAAWSEDEPAPATDPAAATAQGESGHFTQSLRVKQRSVTVRSAPQASDQTEIAGQGLWAFLDENGQLTTTPPAGRSIAFQLPQPRTPVAEVESADTPGAFMVDTSHVVSVATAHKDKHGKVSAGCTHSSAIAPADQCEHESGHAPTQPVAADVAKEDRK
jgi:hypothetical protein